MGLERGGWLAIAAIGTVALLVSVWPSPGGRPDLTTYGPTQGVGEPIYLFQSYDCAPCWNFTVDGPLDAVLDAAADQNRSIVWKSVEPSAGFGGPASHCAWQQFPDRWREWNELAYLHQFEPGLGWPGPDRILFVTENELLLPREETRQFESCLYEDDWRSAVVADTEFWGGQAELPALYVDGQWLPATPESISSI